MGLLKIDVNQRFDCKYDVDADTGCWVWKAARMGTKRRYGGFWDGERYTGAHQYSYRRANGPIPEGHEIDHLCNNPLCVNPNHLDAVTHQENIRRSNAGVNNARKTHCPSGHPYDAENTVIYDGRRYCKACQSGGRTTPAWKRTKKIKPIQGSSE